MPNIVSPARFWAKKVVLLKSEVTYGTDPIPTGLANWIEARNVALTAYDVATVDRNVELPFFGTTGKVIVSAWSKLSFDVALATSGIAGTAPKWGPLMLGSSFAETLTATTSAAYNLITDSPGSMTGYLTIDGTLHKFVGSRGNVKGKISAKGIPMLSIELNSLYTMPVVGAMPTIDRTGWIVEDGVNSVNTGKLTIGVTDLAFSELTWDAGNQLARIDLPGPQKEVMINGRKPSAGCTVMAPALGVFNPYALADSQAALVITNTHGTVAGKKIKTDIKARIIGVAEDNIDGVFAYKLTLDPVPVAGNDEIALTCL